MAFPFNRGRPLKADPGIVIWEDKILGRRGRTQLNMGTWPNILPRIVRAFVRDREWELEVVMARAQSVLGIDPRGELMVGEQSPTTAPGWNVIRAQDFQDELFRMYYRYPDPLGTAEVHWGRFGNFHHILDPATRAAYSVIAQDVIVMNLGGVSDPIHLVFGFYDWNTALDPASLVGIGFRLEGGPSEPRTWITYLRTGLGSPSTVIQETDTGVSGDEETHRLAIVLDAKDSQVLWYIDGVLVDSYAPAAALDQMGALGTKFGYGLISKSASWLHVFGGANVKLLSMLREVL